MAGTAKEREQPRTEISPGFDSLFQDPGPAFTGTLTMKHLGTVRWKWHGKPYGPAKVLPRKGWEDQGCGQGTWISFFSHQPRLENKKTQEKGKRNQLTCEVRLEWQYGNQKQTQIVTGLGTGHRFIWL